MAVPLIPTTEITPDEKALEKLSDSLDTFKNIETLLTKKEKQQYEILKKLHDETKEFVEREKAIQTMLDKNLFTPEQAKTAKMRNKITKYEYKREKNKFWPKMLKGIQTISKGIARMAGNWFTKIIGFLLAMAIFDPKGKMLKSILKFFTGVIVWFVKVLASYLPFLISTMIDLVINVLPGVLVSLVKAIFPAIGKALKTMGDNFIKQGFPILGKIIKWISKIFGEGGILYEFMMMLTKIFPVLLSGFLILGGIVKLWPVLSAIFTGLKILASFLLANPIVAVIAGIVIGLIALYKYSDKVVAFFESIFDWFNKLGSGWKIVISVLTASLAPFIALIYGLAKFFSAIKKHGLKKVLKMIGEWFVKIGKMIFAHLKKIFTGIVSVIFAPFKLMIKTVQLLGKKLSILFKPLLKVLGSIWDLIKNTILRTMTWVKDSFIKIGDIFSAVSHYGPYDFFVGASPLEKSAMLASAKLARVKETSLEEIAERSTPKGRIASDILKRQKVTVESGSIDVKGATQKNIVNIDRTTRKLQKVEENMVSSKLKR